MSNNYENKTNDYEFEADENVNNNWMKMKNTK